VKLLVEKKISEGEILIFICICKDRSRLRFTPASEVVNGREGRSDLVALRGEISEVGDLDY
jgi:hypothetical protein